MLELNLLEFAEWLLADGSNFSLFQETSHYMPIIFLLLSIIIHYISLYSHQIPIIFPSYILRYSRYSSNIPYISWNILWYPQIPSNIPQVSSNIILHPQISSNIPQIPLNIPKYSSDIFQIFLTYSLHILKYPLISSNILKYPQISSNILKYPQIFLKYP